ISAEPRGSRRFPEAEATRLVDSPDPSAWSIAAETFRSPRRPYELAWCVYRMGEAMLALGRARTEVTAVLGEAWRLAVEIGAVPLTEAIESLARIARL